LWWNETSLSGATYPQRIPAQHIHPADAGVVDEPDIRIVGDPTLVGTARELSTVIISIHSEAL